MCDHTDKPVTEVTYSYLGDGRNNTANSLLVMPITSTRTSGCRWECQKTSVTNASTGEAPDSDIQEAHIVEAVAALAPLAFDHELVISHGNGPQVGVLALESARDPALSHPIPLDVIGAQTQGMIGYWLLRCG